MKRMVGFALMAMALSAAGAPVMGQGPGQPGPDYQVQQTQIRLEQERAELAAATAVLAAKRRQYGTATANQAEIIAAEAAVDRARANVALAENELRAEASGKQLSDRIQALRRPVSVQLRDAPVRQAAQTLSQASGITINVDRDVPTDKRLTVVAQDVPLGTILDTVARQTGLLIAPEGNGVLLKLAPTLEVDGQRAELITPFEPWSNEWGQNPTMPGFGISPFPSVAPMRPGQPSPDIRLPTPYVQTPNGPPLPTSPDGTIIQGAPRPMTPAPGYFGPGALPPTPAPGPVYGGFGGGGIGGFGGGGLGGGYGFAASGPPPVTMTALSSNTFVVANPAAGPNGEPAVMLTVYRLEGTALRKVSSTLHRLGPAGAQRGSLRFGPPGGFGGGGFGGGGFPGAGFGGGGGGGFFAPGPETSPKAAPGYSPANPFAAPPGERDQGSGDRGQGPIRPTPDP